MADSNDKYSFSSDEELSRHLSTLDPKARAEFLSNYAKALSKNTASLSSRLPSKAAIHKYEQGVKNASKGASLTPVPDQTTRINKEVVVAAGKLGKSISKKSQMPSNSLKRHHYMYFASVDPINRHNHEKDAFQSPNAFWFQINRCGSMSFSPENVSLEDFNANNCAPGFDEIVRIQDVSIGENLPATPEYQDDWTGNNFRILYDVNDYPNVSAYTKLIEVTWLSGFQKTFELKISFPQNGVGTTTSSSYSATNLYTKDCYAQGLTNSGVDVYKQYDRTHGIGGIGAMSPNDEYQFFMSEIIEGDEAWPGPIEVVQFTPADTPYNRPVCSLKGAGSSLGILQEYLQVNCSVPGSQVLRITRKAYGGEETQLQTSIGTFSDHSFVADANTSNPGTWVEIQRGGSYGANHYWAADTEDGGEVWANVNLGAAGGLFPSAGFMRLNQVQTLGGYSTGFLQEILYAENLSCCGEDPEQSIQYEVCTNPNAPDYYQNTCLDCYGVAIPAGICNGTTQANFVEGNCCTECGNFQLDVSSGVNPSYNGSDGGIFWDVNDPTGGNNPSGTPYGTGSMYTITITDSVGSTITTQPPAGGATFSVSCTTNTTAGTANQVTVSSNSQISPGMSVSGTGIPANTFVHIQGQTGDWNNNITVFALVDSVGVPVSATVAGTNSLTFATQAQGFFGGLPGNPIGEYYTLCASDDNDCEQCVSFTLDEEDPPEGCTDSSSFNYDSAAVVDDGSCLRCDATTGELVENGNVFLGLFDQTAGNTSVGFMPTNATFNTNCVLQSNGELELSATMNSNAAQYLQFDGTQSYTFTLYPLTQLGNLASAGAAVATQTGLTVDVYGASPTHTFTGLTHGYYAVKIELVDSDEVNNLEDCFYYEFCIVFGEVCDDPAALNYDTTMPGPLRIPANGCCNYAPTCCNLTGIAEDTFIRGTICDPFLYAEIDCNPSSIGVTGYWNLNGTQIPNSEFNLGAVSGSVQTIWLMDQNQSSLMTGTGTYEVVITSTYASQDPCTTTISSSYTAPICGCGDPDALNYDPTVTVGLNTCIYPSWNCINGNCVDPADGTGTYNDLTTCQANCFPIIPGCIDPCADNYNSNATDDDGSCIYSACLDQAAANYQFNCGCNQVITTATVNDPTCCQYPCASAPTFNPWGNTPSSGSCTTPIADGSMTSFVTLTNGATTFTAEWFDVIPSSPGAVPIYTDPTVYTSPSSVPLTNVVAGTYWIQVTDNLGCVSNDHNIVGTNSPTQGCTDPTADNFDPSAQCDDGTCEYCGCTDPYADNYNPNAVCDDGSCTYTVPGNPCIPPNINDRIAEITACLSDKGTKWLHKYKIGTADDCITMNKWKLILIQYLLKQDALTCIYNCADEDSPDVSTLNTCANSAVTGGPVTGLNDQGFAGSTYDAATGTVITDPSLFFVQANTLNQGDVITMPSGLVWEVIQPGNCTFGCYNPETNQGQQSGHWSQCVPTNNITVTNNINYIDNFLNFANKYCRDCNINVQYGGNYQI